jgi:hypothetical protein
MADETRRGDEPRRPSTRAPEPETSADANQNRSRFAERSRDERDVSDPTSYHPHPDATGRDDTDAQLRQSRR